MKRPNKKNGLVRTWRASLIKGRMQYLGLVRAKDRATAEAAAVEQFKLTDQQQKRLVLQEQL